MDDTHVQRFIWSSSLTEILVSSLLDLYHDSYWHMEKGFKNGYYNELAKRVRIVAPNSGVLGKLHVESALKMLRTYTLAYHELLTKGSGFSFNYSTHTIEIDEISWKEWKKTHTLAKNVVIRPFPHYDDLCQVYCGSRATGVEETTGYTEREFILGEGIEGVTGVEETRVPDDTQQVPGYVAPASPNPHASSSHTRTREVQKVMECLGLITGLSMDDMLVAADMIIANDAKRTTFLALPEGMRAHWLYKHLSN